MEQREGLAPLDNDHAAVTRVLHDISVLKTRYTRTAEPSRSSISRHRRYSLGPEARRVLKGWVEDNIDDPYPSLPEKQHLAAAANLSLKQVNDVSAALERSSALPSRIPLAPSQLLDTAAAALPAR
jgi:hypothetical protein